MSDSNVFNAAINAVISQEDIRPNSEVLHALWGWGLVEAVHEATATEEARATVEFAITGIEKGLDGPDDSDIEKHTALVSELRLADKYFMTYRPAVEDVGIWPQEFMVDRWIGHINKEPRIGDTTTVVGCKKIDASHTDLTVGRSLAITQGGQSKGFYTGLGWIISHPYMCVDLDHCRNAQTGVTEKWAIEIIEYLDSYTEISFSGTGYHIFVIGEWTAFNKKYGVEIYAAGRYMTMSRQWVKDTPFKIEERNMQEFQGALESGKLGRSGPGSEITTAADRGAVTTKTEGGLIVSASDADHTNSGVDWHLVSDFIEKHEGLNADQIEEAIREQVGASGWILPLS